MSILRIPYRPAAQALKNLDDALALPNASPLAVETGQQLRAALTRAMDEYNPLAEAYNVTERSGLNAQDFTAFGKVVDAATGMAVAQHGYSTGLEPVLDRAQHTLDFLTGQGLYKGNPPVEAASYVTSCLRQAIKTLAPKPGVTPPSTETLDKLAAQVADYFVFLGLSV